MYNGTLSKNPVALICRFFGGCLLTEAWVREASAGVNAEIQCIHYSGIMHQGKTVMFSGACRDNPELAPVIQHVCNAANTADFRLEVEDSLHEMCCRYDKWKDSKGEKSRPWTSLCVAVAHSADYERTVKIVGTKHKRLVRSLDTMLTEWSKVDNDWVCPGLVAGVDLFRGGPDLLTFEFASWAGYQVVICFGMALTSHLCPFFHEPQVVVCFGMALTS